MARPRASLRESGRGRAVSVGEVCAEVCLQSTDPAALLFFMIAERAGVAERRKHLTVDQAARSGPRRFESFRLHDFLSSGSVV